MLVVTQVNTPVLYILGATQAVAVAYDMIQVGRAERVIVIAGDSASSDTLMPWLGNGFRALGAATTCGRDRAIEACSSVNHLA